MVDEMISLKLKAFPLQLIARKMGISRRTVVRYTKSIKHPNNPKFNFDFLNSRMSAEKAEILGYLAAEGCKIEYKSNYKKFDKRRKKTYSFNEIKKRIIFTNLDEEVCYRFSYLVKSVYGYVPRKEARGDMLIHPNDIINDIIKYSDLKCKTWTVPKEVLSAPDDIKCAWLRGFADGDGSVGEYKVHLYSTNIPALTVVCQLLNSLNVKNKLYGPYKKGCANLRVDPISYSEKVGFYHPAKRKKLKQLVSKKTK